MPVIQVRKPFDLASHELECIVDDVTLSGVSQKGYQGIQVRLASVDPRYREGDYVGQQYYAVVAPPGRDAWGQGDFLELLGPDGLNLIDLDDYDDDVFLWVWSEIDIDDMCPEGAIDVAALLVGERVRATFEKTDRGYNVSRIYPPNEGAL